MNSITRLIVIILILIPSRLLAGDFESPDLITRVQEAVDVSHPYYGIHTYGKPKAHIFKSGDQKLLIYQARYGGDGEHTPNFLKVFSYQNESFNDAVLVFEHNLDSIEFETRDDQLISIRGLYIETSCFVCDGWEVSEPEAIFKIPLIIDAKGWSIKVNLTQKDKDELLKRIEKLSAPKDSNLLIDLKERLKQHLNYE